jgi:hypothetical protein
VSIKHEIKQIKVLDKSRAFRVFSTLFRRMLAGGDSSGAQDETAIDTHTYRKSVIFIKRLGCVRFTGLYL